VFRNNELFGYRSSMIERALPYGQPGIITILVLSSFLYLLNIINGFLDRWIYCGLLGQVFIGVAWGTPGTQWLAKTTQEAITQVGYLGLLLLVYEGMIAGRHYRRHVDRIVGVQAASPHPSSHSRPTSSSPSPLRRQGSACQWRFHFPCCVSQMPQAFKHLQQVQLYVQRALEPHSPFSRVVIFLRAGSVLC
jgi:hypothetical protein